MNTYISLPSALADFESIIAHDEKVLCKDATIVEYDNQIYFTNNRRRVNRNMNIICLHATIIANERGEATAWFDNSKPITIMLKEEERAPVYSSTAQEESK